MVMVALLIGAGATGLQTLQKTSVAANQIARLDAVLVVASESLSSKAITYLNCGEPEDYRDALRAADNSRDASGNQLLQTTGSGTPTLDVTEVEKNGCPSADPGLQTLTLTARMGTRTRTAKVTKVDPERRLQLPQAVIDTPVQQSADGDPVAVFALTATNSTTELPGGLDKFEWTCGPNAEDPTPQTFETPTEQLICRYRADPIEPANPDEQTVNVSLKVTDAIGQVDDTTVDIEIPHRRDPRPPPTAVASASSTDINAGQTVDFSSAGSTQPAGTIESYKWDFKDDSSGTASQADTPEASHTFSNEDFPGDHTYEVELTVTDDFGLSDTEVVAVTVRRPTVAAPKAALASPGTYLSPTSDLSVDVALNGGASTSGDGVPLEYSWDFGDGQTENSGATSSLQHAYRYAGNYTVTLSVTDHYGRKASATQQVVVKRALPPTDFRAFKAGNGYMEFRWTPVAAGPGQDIFLEINIIHGVGACSWDDQDNQYKTRTVRQGSGSGYYEWRNPRFCPGTTYEYRVKVLEPEGERKSNDWSPNRLWPTS